MWNLLNSVERTKPSWNSAETLWYMFFLTQYMSNDVATSVQRLNMRHRLQTEEKFKLQSFTDIIPIYEIWYTYNIINQNIDYKSGGAHKHVDLATALYVFIEYIWVIRRLTSLDPFVLVGVCYFRPVSPLRGSSDVLSGAHSCLYILANGLDARSCSTQPNMWLWLCSCVCVCVCVCVC